MNILISYYTCTKFFKINDTTAVELRYVSKESINNLANNPIVKPEILMSDSKEILLAQLQPDIQDSIQVKGSWEKITMITHRQAEELKQNSTLFELGVENEIF